MSLFESFKVPAFRYAWSSISFNSLGNQLNSVALAWLALEFTGSPLGVGVILATRNVPRLLLAIPFGILSDRADRRLLLALANYAGAVSSLIVAIASGQEWFGYVALMFASATSGVIDVAQTNWSKAYVFDVVGQNRAVNGLAMEQLANKLFGMFGGFAGGLLLFHTGAGGIYLAMAVSYALGGLLLNWIKVVGLSATVASPIPQQDEDMTPWRVVIRLLRNPVVLLLALIALSAEVLGYSNEVLWGPFAQEVLLRDERSMGNLIGLLNAGGIVALLLLGAAHRINPTRAVFLVAVGFAVGLMVFSTTRSMLAAGMVILFVGAAWAVLDSLLPTALQLNVANEHRGASVGLWNLSRGFVPIGHLEIGALAAAIGVAATQAINGLLLLVVVAAAGWMYWRVSRKAGFNSTD